MFCKFCGQNIPDTSEFCPECGKKLKKEETHELEALRVMSAPLALMLIILCWSTVRAWGQVLLFGYQAHISMLISTVMLVVGLVLMCFSASLYFTADLGVSTYDFVALYISKIQKKVPFRFVRISTDAVCVTAGFLMGSVPGVGTLITACFMGPLISWFDRTVSVPMRYGRNRA